MNITGIYLRKSRAEELTDSTEETLKRHKDTLLEFAKTLSLNIVETYEEVISGENLYTRTEMLRLLSDIEAGKLNAILCMDIDRLGRGSMSQQGVILETIKAANVKIITPRKTYDLSNEIDEEYTEFQTFFARRELKTIKRRMQQGIHKSLQDGGYISNSPFGYEKCRIGKIPSLKIIDSEAVFVRLMFDMYAHQGIGCHLIAEHLNMLGAVPKRGAKFSRTTVNNILQNQTYIGKIIYNKRKHRKPDDKNSKYWSTPNPKSEWLLSDGLHSPIIDIQTFNKAQEVLLGRYHTPHYSGNLTNPLAGLITCAKCGKKMVRRSFQKGEIVYLICPTTACVKMTSFNCIENSLLAIVSKQLSQLVIQTTPPIHTNDILIEKAIHSTQKEYDVLCLQKQKLHDFLEQDIYTPKLFLERKSALEHKESKLVETLAQLHKKLKSKNNSSSQLCHATIKNALDVYNHASIGEKNRLLKLIIDSVTYYKAKTWTSDKFILHITLKST